MDHEFGREDYDPYDQGDYIPNLVFVAMAFSGQELDEIYSAIKFDIAPLRIQFYLSTEHLRAIISNSLTEMIRKITRR